MEQNLKKFESNDSLYNISIKDYTKLSILTAKESYNINKSMQLKLADEDTKYTEIHKRKFIFLCKKDILY